ncbi:MAG: hypothetical protein M0C28_23810 [Candidatus Moduliflexus flocculans]|nr:hypothetical protein [Candidatus Moduliflexus flocculans]
MLDRLNRRRGPDHRPHHPRHRHRQQARHERRLPQPAAVLPRQPRRVLPFGRLPRHGQPRRPPHRARALTDP